MTTVYPTEEKLNAPPTYEQATYYPPAPPASTFPNVYPTEPNVMYGQVPPPGMYPTSNIVPPTQMQSMGMYTTYTGGNNPPQGPPVGTHMLITTQSLLYGDIPIQCICPHCHQTIVTRVEKSTGLVSWLICGGILLLGGWLGCCLIPFCLDSLKDTEHYCPSCAVLLGVRRRM